MVSVKCEKECDLEKDGPENQEKAASDEKLTDSLSSAEHPKTAEGEPATEEEIKNLFHVVDDIPIGVWLASFVASAERFAWFGATGPLRTANLIPKFAPSFSTLIHCRELPSTRPPQQDSGSTGLGASHCIPCHDRLHGLFLLYPYTGSSHCRRLAWALQDNFRLVRVSLIENQAIASCETDIAQVSSFLEL